MTTGPIKGLSGSKAGNPTFSGGTGQTDPLEAIKNYNPGTDSFVNIPMGGAAPQQGGKKKNGLLKLGVLGAIGIGVYAAIRSKKFSAIPEIIVKAAPEGVLSKLSKAPGIGKYAKSAMYEAKARPLVEAHYAKKAEPFLEALKNRKVSVKDFAKTDAGKNLGALHG